MYHGSYVVSSVALLYTLSTLTGHFTSTVAFATLEVKGLGDKGMLPIACFETCFMHRADQ